MKENTFTREATRFVRREDLTWNRRLRNIRTFGTQSMSYSALQEGIKEFRHPLFKGFVPYMSVWGSPYVLSDPIVPERDLIKATVLFLERYPAAVFCQVSQAYARLLDQMRFTINGFGVEHIIDLDEFRVTWKKRKCLKSYLSKLGKQGYYVFEYPAESSVVRDISRDWLASKQNSRELRFMARPFTSNREIDVRYFYLIKDNKIIGFVSFDPIYSGAGNGSVSSYTLQHLRVSDTAPLGSQDFLILNALSEFKQEGITSVSLGLSPLYKRDHSGFRHSKLAAGVFNLVYRTSAFYNYRTIGEHKDHYKARQVQTFIACRNPFRIRQLCGLLKINNLI